ncbi:T9SS type A sorting domain-containing protein [Balneolales bacterium ANBcel1]|nr:T9SS type A sorting domain-containing protein [Balneolales bacterium ANBcel1]
MMKTRYHFFYNAIRLMLITACITLGAGAGVIQAGEPTGGNGNSSAFSNPNFQSTQGAIVQAEDEILIHHWNFNEIPNDSNFAIATTLLMDVSSRRYGAFLMYDGARWDRVNDPTPLNAREQPYEEDDDRALRLRNPAGSLHLFLPTSGYRDVVFRYAVSRTSNGARDQLVEYSVDGGETYTDEGLSGNLVQVNEDQYKWVEFDFSGIAGVDDNPDFRIRITMTGAGSDPGNDSGNQRINNVTLDGRWIDDGPDRSLIHLWEFNDIPNPDDPDNGEFTFPLGIDISAGGIVGGHSTVAGATIRYDGARWDRVNAPTPFNARSIPYEEESDRALRLRNPSGPFTLRLPTTGYSDVVFRYAVKRTSNGALNQDIAYSIDGENFVSDGLKHASVQVGENYILHEYDFSEMEEVGDNPNFAIRITASGPGSEPDNESGNHRFNNITVDALALSASSVEEPEEVPLRTRLEQNYPNPFNPSTRIRFSLQEQVHVTLEVFDITGRHIQTLIDRPMPGGEHIQTFEPTGLSSGIYLYRLQAGERTFTKRMTYVK